jgi:hypothetical protein
MDATPSFPATVSQSVADEHDIVAVDDDDGATLASSADIRSMVPEDPSRSSKVSGELHGKPGSEKRKRSVSEDTHSLASTYVARTAFLVYHIAQVVAQHNAVELC